MKPSAKNRNPATLIIAASEQDANLYYATHFWAPDPFVFLQIGRRKLLVMSDLELDRAKPQATVDEVLSMSKLQMLCGVAANEVIAKDNKVGVELASCGMPKK